MPTRPFPDAADLAAFVEFNGGLDGIPTGVAIDWDTVANYLERFDGRVSVNIAFLVGNAALRIAAIGWDDVVADDRAVARQRSMLREGLEAGAFGVSSGLDYPPGSYASTAELAALANEAGRLGGIYHSHVRYSLGDRFLDPFREAIEIGRRGEAPAHITHFYHRATFPGTPDQMLALVDDARAEGLDVTFDAYPYEWASTRLLITIPTWVQEGGPGPTKERLADPSVRARIRDELRSRGVMYAGAGGIADIRLGYFGRPEHARWEGRTLGDVGRETGEDLVELLCDLLRLRGSAPQPGHARSEPERDPALLSAPGGHGRHGFDVRRGEAQPAHVRLLPADPRPVRSRRGPPRPRGSRREDDRAAGGATRASAIAAGSSTGSWPTSWSSTRRRSGLSRPTTSRASTRSGSTMSSWPACPSWIAASTPGPRPDGPFAAAGTDLVGRRCAPFDSVGWFLGARAAGRRGRASCPPGPSAGRRSLRHVSG